MTASPHNAGSAPEPQSAASPPPPQKAPDPTDAQQTDSWGALLAGVRVWAQAYRVEIALFAICFIVFAFFSSHRFLRQSAAPHFVYQAQAWLEGRLDIDREVLPNFEDWACVRVADGQKVRCEGPLLPGDKWYVSFPPFPAVVMLPFVALHGYQFNDTSFTVLFAALAIALFYSLLRFLSKERELERSQNANIALALVLAFGTVFFYCAIRGEVWFTAEVMGVGFTALYARNAVRARRPILAGLFFSMATLTRTPLMFSGIFFLLEALAPQRENRLEQLKALPKRLDEVGRKVGLFALGAAPLALIAGAYNWVRFGKFSEFGHSFFYNNQANVKVDRWGLFDPHYLGRNLEAAFLKLPIVGTNPLKLDYDPTGLSLFLTLPILLFIIIPRARRESPRPWWLTQLLWTGAGIVCGAALGSIVQAIMAALGGQASAQEMALSGGFLGGIAGLVWGIHNVSAEQRRMTLPVVATIAVCALPGLFYQHTGAMQFGFRFSLDYTPWLIVLFAMSRWSLSNRWVQAAIALGVLVNVWGALAFRGYTEWLRARGG